MKVKDLLEKLRYKDPEMEVVVMMGRHKDPCDWKTMRTDDVDVDIEEGKVVIGEGHFMEW